jgi:methylated-DNA-[protein]-cysteine S-methyltransferase
MKQNTGTYYCIFTVQKSHAAVFWNQQSEICRLLLPETSLNSLKSRIPQNASPQAPNKTIASVIKAVQNYFSEQPVKFTHIKTDLSTCSEFTRKVLCALSKVGYGKTISYKQLAQAAGCPGGARAIGRALGKNPLPLIIPCHRVIRADGNPGGFSAAGGVKQKLAMLKLENIEIDDLAKTKANACATLTNQRITKGTDHIIETDPEFGKWIKQLAKIELKIDNLTSPFQALLEAIVYQQLTGKAAATIYKRLLSLFGGQTNIAPLDLLRAEDAELRAAGLSGPKIAAIRDLAEKCLAGDLPDLAKLKHMPNDEIIDCLVKIRGIGRWTAEMLLIFRLGRADVLAIDDYGLKKGLTILRNKKELVSAKELKEQGKTWKPYRTIASWYLWRIAESQILKP